MTESICYQCKNYMKRTELGSFNRECILSESANLDNVEECTHFNPKPKVSNELKERRIKALQSGKEPRKKRKVDFITSAKTFDKLKKLS